MGHNAPPFNMTFAKLHNLIKKIESFDTDLILNKTVKENEHIIVDMNFQDQLYEKGVFPDGKPTGEYSPFTLEMKKLPGSHDHKTDHMTFKDEGSFYEGGFVRILKKSFEIDSRDSKRDELVKREGNMFGIIPENLEELSINYFLPDLQKAAKIVIK